MLRDFVFQQLQKRSDPPSSEVIAQLAQQYWQEQDVLQTHRQKKKRLREVADEILGYGPVQLFLDDPDVTEIMINGTNPIFVEKGGVLTQTNRHFATEAALLNLIHRIVSPLGRRIDESHPLVDARLPDGSRVNAIIPPLSLCGPVVTIRKFPHKRFTLEDMLAHRSLSSEMAQYLSQAVVDKQNILICGGTGSGKTSTLNALASLIPSHERLITIEDAAELRIDHPHLVSLEARSANVEGQGEITIRTLVRNALRMRPDRIVVGEIRSQEAIDMLQAMNTGHKGSLSTLHANSPLESLFRLETMALSSDIDLPLPAIRSQIIQSIDLLVQQSRTPEGLRVVTTIASLQKQNLSDYVLKTLFSFPLSS